MAARRTDLTEFVGKVMAEDDRDMRGPPFSAQGALATPRAAPTRLRARAAT